MQQFDLASFKVTNLARNFTVAAVLRVYMYIFCIVFQKLLVFLYCYFKNNI